MKITMTFDAAALGNDNKGAYTYDLAAPLDGSTVAGLAMDIKADPNSAPDAFGNSGYFQLVVRNGDNYDYNAQFGDNFNWYDWHHIEVSPLTGSVDKIRAVTFQLYGGPNQNLTGPVTFWIDNEKFTELPAPMSTALLGVGAL